MNSCPTLQSLLPSDRGLALLEEEVEFLAVKPPEEHAMTEFVCGSVSCAWGDIALHLFEHQDMTITDQILWFRYCRAAVELGISQYEAQWLFADLLLKGHDIIASWFGDRNRGSELPRQTAARLRKFVEYKRRRAELLGDMTTPEGRARYETLRRQEGDHGVCAAVMRSLQQVV